MQNTRYTLLNKLQAKLGDAVTLTDWASSYEGGYWGDCEIENDELYLNFAYGNIYDAEEVDFGEGTVQLKYKGGTDANGLAYTGALDKMIGDKLEELTGGLITCGGSEQGMQGHDGDDESYLSVDMEECSIEETVAA